MFLLYFIPKYLRTSIRTSEPEIAGKIRTSRLSEKKGVLIKRKRCSDYEWERIIVAIDPS